MTPFSLEETLLTALLVMLTVFLITRLKRKPRKKGKLAPNRRQSDNDGQGRAKQMAMRRAKRLYEEKNYREAANILSSLGYHRDAIDLLETAGCILEAARKLAKMDVPERAAALLEKYELYREAMEYHRLAGNEKGIEHCAEQIYQDQVATAKPYAAADYHANCSRYLEAARAYREIQYKEEALAQYLLFAKGDDLPMLEKDEYEFILENVSDVLSLAKSDLFTDEGPRFLLLLQMIHRAYFKVCEAILKENSEYYSQALFNAAMESQDYESYLKFYEYLGEAKLQARIHAHHGEYHEAAVLYEQIGLYLEAKDCFQQAGDFDRAKMMTYLDSRKSGRGLDKDQERAPAKVEHLDLDKAVESMSSERESRMSSPRLKSASNQNIHTYASGQTIVAWDHLGKGHLLYQIVSGSVRVALWNGEREIIVGDLGPKSLFGQTLSNRKLRHFALEETQVLHVADDEDLNSLLTVG